MRRYVLTYQIPCAPFASAKSQVRIRVSGLPHQATLTLNYSVWHETENTLACLHGLWFHSITMPMVGNSRTYTHISTYIHTTIHSHNYSRHRQLFPALLPRQKRQGRFCWHVYYREKTRHCRTLVLCMYWVYVLVGRKQKMQLAT